MTWTVVVDFDLCASNAVCVGIAPDVFAMQDDGSLAILDFESTDEARQLVEETVLMCPTQAISIRES
jgi:ferredoxin